MSFRNLFAERLWQFCLCRTRFNALSHAHVLSLFILLQQALVCFGQRIYCYTWKTCTEYYLRIAATSLCFCSQNPRKGRRRVSEKKRIKWEESWLPWSISNDLSVAELPLWRWRWFFAWKLKFNDFCFGIINFRLIRHARAYGCGKEAELHTAINGHLVTFIASKATKRLDYVSFPSALEKRFKV